jgi:hypothetical protein
VAVEAPLHNGPGDRHPAKLIEVVRQFHLDDAERYRPEEMLAANGSKHLRTWCNVAINDLTTALECAIPRILPNGHEQRANDMYLWLIGVEGRRAGWWQVSRELASRNAAIGCPVVATWFNDSGGPGHLALVMPAMSPAPNIEGALQLATGQLFTAQAGAERWSHGPLERGFGTVKPIFIAHA